MFHQFLVGLSPGGAFTDVGRSLRAGFFMFWETLWALVLGLGLSGVVQAFVTRDETRRALGTHRPAAVARAAGLGAASSSCSYAAAAMAKSLFAQGADFVTALVFQCASTNLVIELGLVLLALAGWQFAVGELLGGVIMIALLALVGSTVFGARLVTRARQHLETRQGRGTATTASPLPWRERLRDRSLWLRAIRAAVSDWSMLKRELLIGYVVAGFIATLVPNAVWHDVFWRGHGTLTTLENVAVGPLVALVSFVCSIGNVPLAAALWTRGVGFGGVVSFLLADLIAFPMVLLYRKLYGTKMALRILVVFWCLMALSGLGVDELFRAGSLIPGTRPRTVAPLAFHWDVTTVFNLFAVALVALVWWMAHRPVPASHDHADEHEVHRSMH